MAHNNQLVDPDGDYVSPDSHDHKPGRDSMYEAADKAKAGLDADMSKYDKSAVSQKNVAPSPNDPSLTNNARGYPSTPGRSSNMGENVRS